MTNQRYPQRRFLVADTGGLQAGLYRRHDFDGAPTSVRMWEAVPVDDMNVVRELFASIPAAIEYHHDTCAKELSVEYDCSCGVGALRDAFNALSTAIVESGTP